MKYTYHKKQPTVYPQDIQCVFEGKTHGAIYVGNLQASENLKTLQKLNIRGVLTAARDIYLNHPKNQIPHYMYIPGEDHQRFDLSVYFDRCADFIHRTLQQTNILVHCMAGISRSVSLVLAYMMKYHNMTFKQALNSVRNKRRIVNPNRGFIKQLQEYEKKIFRNQRTTQTNEPRQMSLSGVHIRNQARNKSYMRQSFYRRSDYINQSRTKTPNIRKMDDLDEKIRQIRQKYVETTNLLERNKLKEQKPVNIEDRQNLYKSYYMDNFRQYNKPKGYRDRKTYESNLSSNLSQWNNMSAYNLPKRNTKYETLNTNYTRMRSSMMENYLQPRSKKPSFYDYNY